MNIIALYIKLCVTKFANVKGGGTKNQKGSTKYIFYQFSALQTPRKIQNLFLNRALIPQDYNTGLQIRDFWCAFS